MVESVINYAQSLVSLGGVPLAVSTDIVNALNFLPWKRINRALPRYRLPQYLRNYIIRNYLSEWSIVYSTAGGCSSVRKVNRSVPKEPVLGLIM